MSSKVFFSDNTTELETFRESIDVDARPLALHHYKSAFRIGPVLVDHENKASLLVSAAPTLAVTDGDETVVHNIEPALFAFCDEIFARRAPGTSIFMK